MTAEERMQQWIKYHITSSGRYLVKITSITKAYKKLYPKASMTTLKNMLEPFEKYEGKAEDHSGKIVPCHKLLRVTLDDCWDYQIRDHQKYISNKCESFTGSMANIHIGEKGFLITLVDSNGEFRKLFLPYNNHELSEAFHSLVKIGDCLAIKYVTKAGYKYLWVRHIETAEPLNAREKVLQHYRYEYNWLQDEPLRHSVAFSNELIDWNIKEKQKGKQNDKNS